MLTQFKQVSDVCMFDACLDSLSDLRKAMAIAQRLASGKFPANAERDLMTALDLPIVTGQQCSCKPLGLLSSCRMSLAFLLFAMPLPDGTCIIAELFRHQFVLWSTLTTGVCLPHCQTKLAAQLQTQAMYFLQIPIKDVSSDDKHARTTMRVPMVLPHELLNYLVVAW